MFAEEEILDDDNPDAFGLTREGLRWRTRTLPYAEAAHARRERLHSIGSCSFFEPVAELEEIGVLPL